MLKIGALDYNVMKMVLDLCILSPQNTESQSNHKENIIQIPTERHSTKLLAGTPQNDQGSQT